MAVEQVVQALTFRCIGPYRGGRVVAVAGHPSEPGTFYFGACAGGVWKTTNGGSHWENISDGFLGTAAIGAIAVSEADPNVIYVGTGEACIRNNVCQGDGVYKSTDGGRTWTNVGLRDSRHIGKIVIHPHDPDTVYVAALGNAFGPNRERGVFRSRDGGRTWECVLFKSEHTGAIDITIDQQNPRILYAALWQTRRYPWALVSGGEESGIWRSLDGGTTWEEITRRKGLPKAAVLGRIGLAASPAQSGRVWAIIEAEDGGLFRSDDYGETWELCTDDLELRRRPFYYMHLTADPVDPNTIWVMNLQLWKSVDGGKTFESVPTPHGDNHALWIDPKNPNRMIEGNDGGACISFDGGRTWTLPLNQPTAQFYHLAVDQATPYRVYGSQQDNWAISVPSIGTEGAISWPDWVEPGGGESGHLAISPKPPHVVYCGAIGTGYGHGRLIAWDPITGQKRNVTVWPEVHGSGVGAEYHKYRFQWTFPIAISPHDPDVLYACSNVVHRSRDGGESWEVISPDLTRNDPEKLKASGGPITADNSGAEVYCTIFAFAESPVQAGVLWAGSDDGLVHVSRDGGATWQNVTPPDLPEWATIATIEPMRDNAGGCYLVAHRYRLDDDWTPYVYVTTDFGQTWRRITNGLPMREIIRVIRIDPAEPRVLYAGGEFGVYVSVDQGEYWHAWQANLPVVPVHDLAVVGDELVVATHGRSFWICDDVTPLRQLAQGVAPGQSAVVLFQPRTTIRWRIYGRGYNNATIYTNYKMLGPVTGSYRVRETPLGTKEEVFLDAGQNPPDGVLIHYQLPTDAERVELRIRDAAGNLICAFSSASEEPPRPPATAGVHRFIWDMRYPAPAKLEGEAKKSRFEQTLATAVRPRALPGEYQVELVVGDQTVTQHFTIVKDPRVRASDADLRAQFELKVAIRDRIDEIHQAVNRIRRLRRQVEEWEARAQGAGKIEQIAEAANALRERLTALEREFIQVDAEKAQPGPTRVREKLVALSSMIDESEDRPTQGAYAVYEQLAQEVERLRQQLEHVVAQEVAAFAAQLNRVGVPALV